MAITAGNGEEFLIEELLGLAKTRTGLTDFGESQFRIPLGELVNALNDEACLNETGFNAARERLVNALSNRLRKVELLKRHPEIHAEVIDVAGIIIGLPRTGSTMLHRLLAASPNLTAVKWWESVFPLPRGILNEADVKARQSDAETLVDDILSAAQGFEAIHPLNAHAYDEELPLIEQSFVSNLPESMMYLPSYGAWLLQADQTRAYEELIDYLKILQWAAPERRGKKWVLKCPHHLTAIQTCLDLFPNAVIVMTHRPVEDLVPSWCSMVATLTGAYSDKDFSILQAKHWTERLKRNLSDMIEARSEHEERFIDINYKDLLSKPEHAAERFFKAVNLSVEPEDVSAWTAWLKSNRRGDRPKHEYSMEQFGLNPRLLKSEFDFYTSKYREHL